MRSGVCSAVNEANLEDRALKYCKYKVSMAQRLSSSSMNLRTHPDSPRLD